MIRLRPEVSKPLADILDVEASSAGACFPSERLREEVLTLVLIVSDLVRLGSVFGKRVTMAG